MMMDHRPLTEDERDLMKHITMFGSAGYPVKKLGSRGWVWSYCSIKGPPKVFKTKREATESFEAYYEIVSALHRHERFLSACADERVRHKNGVCTGGESCPVKGETT